MRFFMFHLFFHQCLWVFPMFPLVFLPVFYYRLCDLKSTTCKKTDQFNMIEIAKKLVRDNQTWLPQLVDFEKKKWKQKTGSFQLWTQRNYYRKSYLFGKSLILTVKGQIKKARLIRRTQYTILVTKKHILIYPLVEQVKLQYSVTTRKIQKTKRTLRMKL